MDIKTLFSVEGKVALVTGGGAGVGFKIVEGLLEAGVKVYVCGRTEETLQNACAELAEKDVHFFQADVGTDEGIATIKTYLEARESRLHILVNNVGISHRAPISDYERSDFNRIFNVNVSSAFQMVRALLPLLKAAADPKDPARVVNISSVGARKLMPLDNFAYSASKSALDTLTRHLAAELVQQHINVNAIPCGVFRTPGSAYLFDPNDPRSVNRPKTPMDRPGETEDIVGAVIYLSSRASNFVTGIRLPVSGGLSIIDWDNASRR